MYRGIHLTILWACMHRVKSDKARWKHYFICLFCKKCECSVLSSDGLITTVKSCWVRKLCGVNVGIAGKKHRKFCWKCAMFCALQWWLDCRSEEWLGEETAKCSCEKEEHRKEALQLYRTSSTCTLTGVCPTWSGEQRCWGGGGTVGVSNGDDRVSPNHPF